MIKFDDKNCNGICHGFREMFMICKALNDVHMGSDTIRVMLDGVTNDLLHALLDLFYFHVCFGVADFEGRSNEAPTN